MASPVHALHFTATQTLCVKCRRPVSRCLRTPEEHCSDSQNVTGVPEVAICIEHTNCQKQTSQSFAAVRSCDILLGCCKCCKKHFPLHRQSNAKLWLSDLQTLKPLEMGEKRTFTYVCSNFACEGIIHSNIGDGIVTEPHVNPNTLRMCYQSFRVSQGQKCEKGERTSEVQQGMRNQITDCQDLKRVLKLDAAVLQLVLSKDKTAECISRHLGTITGQRIGLSATGSGFVLGSVYLSEK